MGNKSKNNNVMKQSKIYTEEQVKQMIDMAHNGYDGYYDIMSPFAPIYLPDTDELKEISKHEILYNDTKRSWWLEGAEWMRDIIKGGNNE